MYEKPIVYTRTCTAPYTDMLVYIPMTWSLKNCRALRKANQNHVTYVTNTLQA